MTSDCPGRERMKLSIQSQESGIAQVQIEGRISQRDFVSEQEPLQLTLGQDAFEHSVLLDMSEVEAIDSSGVNWLLNCQKRMGEAGGNLVLHSLSPIARNVIRVLNLQTVFALANDVSQAQTFLDGDSA